MRNLIETRTGFKTKRNGFDQHRHHHLINKLTYNHIVVEIPFSMSAIQFDQAMIERRKKQDNAYRSMDEVIANDKKLLLKANFEISTTSKLDQLSKKVRNNSRDNLIDKQNAILLIISTICCLETL